ncbi:hypothetical protein PsorP6_000701 [Peronosclerospora sorghi]|uniref:Uncharacterized protein n=1 Tax=Peronosclerospora sorghi TaxID=230839 RepID=A0ACC0WY37_9STRA|nr:hypothetical protein PsorP6_000701 [Peronosclerospora sorghi]
MALEIGSWNDTWQHLRSNVHALLSDFHVPCGTKNRWDSFWQSCGKDEIAIRADAVAVATKVTQSLYDESTKACSLRLCLWQGRGFCTRLRRASTIILASLQAALASYDATIHNAVQVGADVEKLYKTGRGKMGTDEEGVESIEHLLVVAAAYEKKYRESLVKAAAHEFRGHAEKAVLFLIRMITEPLELLAELFKSAMKGFGTDENALSSAVVRYHIVLRDIKPVYKRRSTVRSCASTLLRSNSDMLRVLSESDTNYIIKAAGRSRLLVDIGFDHDLSRPIWARPHSPSTSNAQAQATGGVQNGQESGSNLPRLGEKLKNLKCAFQDGFLNLELLEKEQTPQIRTIWNKFHADKDDAIATALNATELHALVERAKRAPYFIFPVYRQDGFF